MTQPLIFLACAAVLGVDDSAVAARISGGATVLNRLLGVADDVVEARGAGEWSRWPKQALA